MKIPLEIQKIRDPNGATHLRAVVSLQYAIVHKSLDQDLTRIQNDYVNFVDSCNEQLRKIQSSRKYMSNSFLQWELADKIYSFIKRIESDGYIFANISEALPRDTGLSESQLNYLIRFRTYYPTIDQVHKEINWSKYREILDINKNRIRKICEEKILSGEIKTDRDIREFKRKNRENKL